MRSFRKQPSNRRAVYLKLAGSIESQLRQAYAKKHKENGLTQVALASKLGVNKAVVNRRLTGRTNMTIETIADMVWALDQCVAVDIFDPAERPSNGHQIIPTNEAAAVTFSGDFYASTTVSTGEMVLCDAKPLEVVQ